MKYPQVVSILGPSADAVLVVWGGYVLKDTPPAIQEPITSGPITVDVDIFNVTTGAYVGKAGATSAISMTYDTNSKFWSIPLATGTPTINSLLTDRNKYVARVSEHSGGGADMREFSLNEFAIDNNSFEETIMRLPFEVRIAGLGPLLGTPIMVWYDNEANFGVSASAKYYAKVYSGGVGTGSVPSDPSQVTHRGPITIYTP